MPSQDELKTMDWSFLGEPYVQIATDSTIDTKTLDVSFNAEPFTATLPKKSASSNFIIFF